MTSSSLIVKGPRVRRAPNRYSPSPTTAHFSRTHKRALKKKPSTKDKTNPKKRTTNPTPKKITKEKTTPTKESTKTTPKTITKEKTKKKEKAASAFTAPSPKTKIGRKPPTQRSLTPTVSKFKPKGIAKPRDTRTTPFWEKWSPATIEKFDRLSGPRMPTLVYENAEGPVYARYSSRGGEGGEGVVRGMGMVGNRGWAGGKGGGEEGRG